MTDGFASVVDVVAHEYGWDIDYILDLSIGRLRFLLRTIERRRKEEFKSQALLTEWLAKQISLTVASTVAGKNGVALQKDVIKRVKFKFDEDTDADTEIEAPGADDNYDFVEKGSRTAENQMGSLEALTGGLGG